jgi:hypothetical protein
MSKLYVPVILFYSGLDGSTSLSDVHLATRTGDSIHTWSTQLQIVLYRMEEAGYLFVGKPTLLVLCLANMLLRWLYVVWTYGRRVTEVGLSFSLEAFTVRLRACCICVRLYPFFLKVVLRNSQHNWEAVLVTQSSASLHQGCKNGLFVGGVVM